MRILFVNHASNLTGASISCLSLITGLGKEYEPVFATREEGPVVGRLKGLGIKSYVLKNKGFLGIKYVLMFLKILREEKINLIHLNTLTPFCKYAGIAGFLKNIPIVWFVRENPLISRSRRLRFWLRRLSSKIIFVDRNTKEQLLGNAPMDRVGIVYNGVDTERFRPFESNFFSEMFNIDRDKLLIGYIGQITARKGIEYLVKALPLIRKKTSNFKLLIIGGRKAEDEAYFFMIKEMIKGLSLEKDVYFTGVVEDVSSAINNLDIIVLPSLEERCSRVLIESLACGKPAVATRVGGTPEIIEDGLNGFLVNPEDPEDIAEAALKLLEDRGLRLMMGKEGRMKAEKVFDLRKNLNKMRDVYLKLHKGY
jgi:glycosyltransferase involved in cell wall biosynthesis